MSSVTTMVFVLIGPLAGKTANLGSQPFAFVNGRCQITASVGDLTLYARYLERCWQAYPEGHPKLEEWKRGQRDLQADSERNGQHEVSSDLQPDGGRPETGVETDAGVRSAENAEGGAGVLSDGDRHPTELNERLLKAVYNLDPSIDDHWTQEGKPAMSAVEKLYGSGNVTRPQVDEVAPGYNRKQAQEVADALRQQT